METRIALNEAHNSTKGPTSQYWSYTKILYLPICRQLQQNVLPQSARKKSNPPMKTNISLINIRYSSYSEYPLCSFCVILLTNRIMAVSRAHTKAQQSP